jgi:RNA polymerase sigma-70 factor (ECF subfamily)
MAEGSSFEELMRRVRSGDGAAATELVKKYEPAIRMEVRRRLRDPRLHRVLDSMDVCQSVLASFFVRATAGEYDLDQPDQLIRLLIVMTRNKVAYQARKHHAQRRDQRRVEPLDGAELQLAGGEHTPSRIIAAQDFLKQFRDRLTEEERRLADLRAQGWQWEEIAAELGGTAQARRRQLTRAADRVLQELGLDEAD